ncbi:SRPBCC domain-containing protein [Streptomyces sp. NPDC090994]|uniref:SRPBCC domain-containing protein n=1 Tax=Streptomyces sp. NPDC090994 TaxID=3365969 RepID=UPI0037F251F8
MTTQHAIDWPERYLPGTGDTFVSNEVIVQGVTASRAWRFLVDTSTWESYYDNVADLSFPDGDGPEPADGVRFAFGTFGFPPLDARVVEFLHQPGVQHVEPDLPGGRTRILTQESQFGKPAADLAGQTPNPMLNGHQAWLDGLVRAARGQVAG